MPKGVKGTHAFRASQQSHGAASLMKIVKGKGKEKEGRSNDEEPQVDISFPLTSAFTLASAPIPVSLSASTSASAPISSKCRYSALDNGESILLTSHNSDNSSSKKAEAPWWRHGRRGQSQPGHHQHLNVWPGCWAQALQTARRCMWWSTDGCTSICHVIVPTVQAQGLQQTEMYLDADHMVALIHLVSSVEKLQRNNGEWMIRWRSNYRKLG